MKKVIITSMLALALLATQSLKAQNQKFGFVDASRVFDTIPQMDTLRSALNIYQQGIYTSLGQSEADIQKKYQEYQTIQSGPVTAQTQQKLEITENLIKSMQQNLELDKQQAQSSLEQKQYALLLPLNVYINKQIERIAKSKGYSHILSSAPTNMYYSVNDNEDITADIIKIMFDNAPKVQATPQLK
ncbi:MAG: OmpH family outer membrane protein [Bacteroidia bacterium]|nr:OmpH family outer membrane protein [Bacteroidia bacterium]